MSLHIDASMSAEQNLESKILCVFKNMCMYNFDI